MSTEDDEFLKRAKLDMYYYRSGRRHEREWIIAWLRREQRWPGTEIADELEKLKDLDGN